MLTYVLLTYVLRAPRYVRDDDMRRVYLQNQENTRNISGHVSGALNRTRTLCYPS